MWLMKLQNLLQHFIHFYRLKPTVKFILSYCIIITMEDDIPSVEEEKERLRKMLIEQRIYEREVCI